MSGLNAKALHLLDRISQVAGISEDAKYGLIQLINPFADFSLPKVGYYDTNESSSVVQCVKYSATYAAPAAAGAGNWDMHVFTTPFIGVSFPPQPCTTGGGYVCIAGSANGYNAGGTTVMTGAPGAALSLVNAPALAAGSFCGANALSPAISQTAPGSGYLDDRCRIIGQGFEIHNTTATIQKQGSLCVWRMPQGSIWDRVNGRLITAQTGPSNNPTTVQFYGDTSLAVMNDVPSSLAQALLLNGSQQWDAADGCMVVPTLSTTEVPVQQLNNITPVVLGTPASLTLTTVSNGAAVYNGSAGVALTSLNPFQILPYSTTLGTLPITSAPVLGNHISAFNSSGAYLTGLSNQSTITVNSVYYIERFPNPNDGNLVVLANPSPAYCSAAMQLYTEIMRSLPVGVKVDQNADGDWFFEAVKSVADFLSPALSLAGNLHPALAAIGPAAGNAVSTWATEKLKERNPGVAPAQQKKKKAAKKVNPPAVKVQRQPKQPQAASRRPPGYSKKEWALMSPAQKARAW
jgi:hypothetical protein